LVIVICLIFAICDLEFLITPSDCRKRGKSIQAPSGGSPKPSPSPHSGIFDGPGFFTFDLEFQDGHYLSRPPGSVNVTLARILYEMSAETADMTSFRASSGVPSAGSGQAHPATYCTLTLQARFWNSDFRFLITD
jgi:hypothetical protein